MRFQFSSSLKVIELSLCCCLLAVLPFGLIAWFVELYCGAGRNHIFSVLGVPAYCMTLMIAMHTLSPTQNHHQTWLVTKLSHPRGVSSHETVTTYAGGSRSQEPWRVH